MKTKALLPVILLAVALLFGQSIGYAFPVTHQGCSCCSGKCHSAKKCHENSRECFCRNLVPSQVCLLKSDILSTPEYSGYLPARNNHSYTFLSAKDIFHPPKVILS